jgi:hypothetical protein
MKKKIYLLIKSILFLFLFLLISPYILYLAFSPQKNENVSYGLNFSDKYATEMGLDWKEVFNETLEEFPTKKFRIALYWDQVEKDRGNYDFSNIKYQLDKLEKFPESEVILVIGRKVIRYPECHEPHWWRELSSQEEQKAEVLKYVEKTVKELKGYRSIKYYQVENEPFFPFGYCTKLENLGDLVEEEVRLVRSLDPERKILMQDSGEAGFWNLSAHLGDYLGISIYRKVWFDLFGILTGQSSFPLKYPIGPAYYKIKSHLLGIEFEKIKATEVQAEPWGPVRNDLLTVDDINKTMSPDDFKKIFEFNYSTGFSEFHLWGVEWWYQQKKVHNNDFYWEYAKSKMK